MIRTLAPGSSGMVFFRESITAGAVMGLDTVPSGMQLTVDGRAATPDTPVGPESTVALQPRIDNG